MICEKCGKNIATTHIETYRNGKLTKRDLCSKCAAEENVSANFQMGLGGLLGSIFGDGILEPAVADGAVCPTCGMKFVEIARTGKVGCADCYQAFYDRLLPTIHKIHGKTTHQGKKPGVASQTTVEADAKVKQPDRTAELRQQLKEAVAAEEFEKAASLRDAIKKLEGGKDHE